MGNIRFYNTEIKFLPGKRRRIVKWLNATAAIEGKTARAINYIFCSDEYLYNLNKQFLKHNDYTDILTFEDSNSDGIGGDIFVSYERIKENAIKYNSLTINELHRVMVHGLLHLLGYMDKTLQQKTIMTQKEDFYLNLRNKFDL